jgi:DNA-binding protein
MTETKSASNGTEEEKKIGITRMSSGEHEHAITSPSVIISRKILFMENVERVVREYRRHSEEIAKGSPIILSVRGNTISLGFSIACCVVDRWCQDLEISEVLYTCSVDSEASPKRLISEYQNDLIVRIVLRKKE